MAYGPLLCRRSGREVHPAPWLQCKSNQRYCPSFNSISTSTHSGLPLAYFEKEFTKNFDLSTIKFKTGLYGKDLMVNLVDLRNRYGADRTFKERNSTSEDLAAAIISQVLKKNRNQQAKVYVTMNKEIAHLKKVTVPSISSVVKPDVSISKHYKSRKTENDMPMVFIEVVSDSNLIKTIRKLYLVLLLQIIYIRSFAEDAKKVTGLVLPTKEDKNLMVSVTVEWNPQAIKFIGSLDIVPLEQLQDKVDDMVAKQLQYASATCEYEKIYFSDTLYEDDIKLFDGFKSFDDKPIFFRSKFSIIFAMGNKVYKRPLSSTNLDRFFLTKIQKNPAQVLCPEDKLNDFYVFPYLLDPLPISKIRPCFNGFVKSVYDAIVEFHKCGYAHLDIRRPNICFSADKKAVLIDLDFAERVNHENWSDMELILGSVMYTDFHTPDLCDWRQFGIMLAHIIQGSEQNYHTQLPKFSDDECGKELEKCVISGTEPDISKLALEDGDVETLADVLNSRTID